MLYPVKKQLVAFGTHFPLAHAPEAQLALIEQLQPSGTLIL